MKAGEAGQHESKTDHFYLIRRVIPARFPFNLYLDRYDLVLNRVSFIFSEVQNEVEGSTGQGQVSKGTHDVFLDLKIGDTRGSHSCTDLLSLPLTTTIDRDKIHPVFDVTRRALEHPRFLA